MSIKTLTEQADAAERKRRSDAGIHVPGTTGSQMSTSVDPLAKQRPRKLDEWLQEPETLYDTYLSVWLCRNIADVLSEDLVKNWFTVKFDENADEDELQQLIQGKTETLGAKTIVQQALCDEIVFGDGLVGIGIGHKGGGIADPAEKVKLDQVDKIVYLERLPRWKRFKDIVLEKDETSEDYGQPREYKLWGLSGESDKTLHASRAMHFQMRPRVDKVWGLSLYTTLWSVAQVVENTAWSLGQVAYNMATRAYKSDELLGSYEQRSSLMDDLEDKMNSLSFLVFGENEDIKTISNSPGNLAWFINFVWDLVAGSTRINRARLLGSQTGKLASAESDRKRYGELIRRLQESHMRKPLRKLVELILATEGKHDTPFRIIFNPFETLSKKEEREDEERRAEIALKKAQAMKELATAVQMLLDLNVVDAPTMEAILTGESVQTGGLMGELLGEGEE